MPFFIGSLIFCFTKLVYKILFLFLGIHLRYKLQHTVTWASSNSKIWWKIYSALSVLCLLFFHLVKLFVASYLVKLFYHSNQFLFKDQSQTQTPRDTSAFCDVFVLWQYSNSMPCNLQKKKRLLFYIDVCVLSMKCRMLVRNWRSLCF